jgi:hypothetical protein
MEERNESWYDMEKIFSVQLCLHILADVMCEINKLNNKSQEEYVDVTSLGETIDVTINNLKMCFFGSETFGDGTCVTYLSF